MSSALVSTQWLSENIGNPHLKLIDSSYFPPNIPRHALNEYKAAHIPGAVFFNIDEIADTSAGLPHMLPDADFFARKVSMLGIGNDDLVVAYDAMGLFSASRAWWMFRAMGHENVFVLDGGLPKWRAENRPLTTDTPQTEPAHYKACLNPTLLRRITDIENNLISRKEQLLDARSPGRFAGTEAEVWPGRKGGHIPGACNIPFPNLLTADQTLKSKEELQKIFAAFTGAPLTVCCGSGVSACVLALGLHEIGRSDVAVYDGSWAEWGLEAANHPVETGSLSSGQ